MVVRNVLCAGLLALGTIGTAFGQAPPPPPMLMIDAGSNPASLLRRPEVQNHLKLDLRQKNALQEMFGKGGDAVKVNLSLTSKGPEEPSEAERNRAIKEQVDSQLKAQRGERDARIRGILTPEQAMRLHELELQWRGPLALADSSVAEEIKLTADHRAEVAHLAATFQVERGRILQQEMTVVKSEPGTMMFRGPDLDNPLSPARQKIDPLKKETEEKILATLSPEERQAWQDAQGAPFVFRKDKPTKTRNEGIIRFGTAGP